MKVDLKYYVIFTCELYEPYDGGIAPNVTFKQAIPDTVLDSKVGRKKLFKITEKNVKPDEHIMYSRKYVALLDHFELVELLDQMYVDETCKTMGALTEYGLLDAISFSSYDNEYGLNAYVSPFPCFTEKQDNYLENLIKNNSDMADNVRNNVSKPIHNVLDFLENDILELDLNDIDIVDENVPSYIEFIPNQYEIEFK